ncbi:conserved hypothetical protein [Perkinsus marinus ATCC 50983]|uniref:Uncharacterized protein n=1 Tax=Perkinsus marinus (strain ATCC 50983 / TXsc) TaxID=423536 RepID=C5LBN9_PERM5|nr:conserved hypothetical protein [Perkinsus marinus ATCC 50983]EER05860.1 conserved hypothetical protein [Perkinsus marinus ATCC 50983]|eukprot:XP_002774044.1 conserved hypothetical protein [Perkinsus marinus ATCC 50983]
MPFRRPQLLSDSQYHDCFSDASSDKPVDDQQADPPCSRPSAPSRILPGYELGMSMQSGEASRISRGRSPDNTRGISQLKCIGSQEESSLLIDVSTRVSHSNNVENDATANVADPIERVEPRPISPNVLVESSQIVDGSYPSYVYTPADLSISTPLLMGQAAEGSSVLGPSFSLNRSRESLIPGYRRSACFSQLDSLLEDGPGAATSEVLATSQVRNPQGPDSVEVPGVTDDPEPESALHEAMVDLTADEAPLVQTNRRAPTLVKTESPKAPDEQPSTADMSACSDALRGLPISAAFEKSLALATDLGLLEDSAVPKADAYPSLSPPKCRETLDEVEMTAVQADENDSDRGTPSKDGEEEEYASTSEDGEIADQQEEETAFSAVGVAEWGSEGYTGSDDDDDSEPGEEPTPERSAALEATAMQDDDEEEEESAREEFPSHNGDSEGVPVLAEGVLERSSSETFNDGRSSEGDTQSGEECESTRERDVREDGHSVSYESCPSVRRATVQTEEFRSPSSGLEMVTGSSDSPSIDEDGPGTSQKQSRKRQRSTRNESFEEEEEEEEERSAIAESSPLGFPERFSPDLMEKVFRFLKLKPPLHKVDLRSQNHFDEKHALYDSRDGPQPAAGVDRGRTTERRRHRRRRRDHGKGAADPYAAARQRLQE